MTWAEGGRSDRFRPRDLLSTFFSFCRFNSQRDCRLSCVSSFFLLLLFSFPFPFRLNFFRGATAPFCQIDTSGVTHTHTHTLATPAQSRQEKWKEDVVVIVYASLCVCKDSRTWADDSLLGNGCGMSAGNSHFSLTHSLTSWILRAVVNCCWLMDVFVVEDEWKPEDARHNTMHKE